MAPTTDTTPAVINTHSVYCLATPQAANGGSGSPASAVWPTASRAWACPLRPTFGYACLRAFVVNGAAVAGNVDIGIYDQNFALVASAGAFAQAGVNASQFVTLVATLSAGTLYYLAISLTNGAATVFRSTLSAATYALAGVVEMAAANPLPATFVPETPTLGVTPLFGITRTSSGF